jgi:hypothetical protein
MSRRTERPYQLDGAGELARHSAARRSAPEINGPVVQQEFTSLLGETCRPAPSETAGAAVSNGHRRAAGVSRSTESNEPEINTGWPHNSGRAELGRQSRPSVVLSWSAEAERLSYRTANTVAEKECCLDPQGLPGTAVRGPACTVVWEAGGASLRRPDWPRAFHEPKSSASGIMHFSVHTASVSNNMVSGHSGRVSLA